VPCTVVHGAGLARARVHGNAGRGLGALGGMVASEWHVHYAAQGGSEVAASRGIDCVHVEELNGEVTGLEVVGAVSPKLGAHDGHGDAPGRRGVVGSGLCSVGSR
jgi:hypothetical protein